MREGRYDSVDIRGQQRTFVRGNDRFSLNLDQIDSANLPLSKYIQTDDRNNFLRTTLTFTNLNNYIRIMILLLRLGAEIDGRLLLYNV